MAVPDYGKIVILLYYNGRLSVGALKIDLYHNTMLSCITLFQYFQVLRSKCDVDLIFFASGPV